MCNCVFDASPSVLIDFGWFISLSGALDNEPQSFWKRFEAHKKDLQTIWFINNSYSFYSVSSCWVL